MKSANRTSKNKSSKHKTSKNKSLNKNIVKVNYRQKYKDIIQTETGYNIDDISVNTIYHYSLDSLINIHLMYAKELNYPSEDVKYDIKILKKTYIEKLQNWYKQIKKSDVCFYDCLKLYNFINTDFKELIDSTVKDNSEEYIVPNFLKLEKNLITNFYNIIIQSMEMEDKMPIQHMILRLKQNNIKVTKIAEKKLIENYNQSRQEVFITILKNPTILKNLLNEEIYYMTKFLPRPLSFKIYLLNKMWNEEDVYKDDIIKQYNLLWKNYKKINNIYLINLLKENNLLTVEIQKSINKIKKKMQFDEYPFLHEFEKKQIKDAALKSFKKDELYFFNKLLLNICTFLKIRKYNVTFNTHYLIELEYNYQIFARIFLSSPKISLDFSYKIFINLPKIQFEINFEKIPLKYYSHFDKDITTNIYAFLRKNNATIIRDTIFLKMINKIIEHSNDIFHEPIIFKDLLKKYKLLNKNIQCLWVDKSNILESKPNKKTKKKEIKTLITNITLQELYHLPKQIFDNVYECYNTLEQKERLNNLFNDLHLFFSIRFKKFNYITFNERKQSGMITSSLPNNESTQNLKLDNCTINYVKKPSNNIPNKIKLLVNTNSYSVDVSKCGEIWDIRLHGQNIDKSYDWKYSNRYISSLHTMYIKLYLFGIQLTKTHASQILEYLNTRLNYINKKKIRFDFYFISLKSFLLNENTFEKTENPLISKIKKYDNISRFIFDTTIFQFSYVAHATLMIVDNGYIYYFDPQNAYRKPFEGFLKKICQQNESIKYGGNLYDLNPKCYQLMYHQNNEPYCQIWCGNLSLLFMLNPNRSLIEIMEYFSIKAYSREYLEYKIINTARYFDEQRRKILIHNEHFFE